MASCGNPRTTESLTEVSTFFGNPRKVNLGSWSDITVTLQNLQLELDADAIMSLGSDTLQAPSRKSPDHITAREQPPPPSCQALESQILAGKAWISCSEQPRVGVLQMTKNGRQPAVVSRHIGRPQSRRLDANGTSHTWRKQTAC